MQTLKHDPEEWTPVFRIDRAQWKKSASLIPTQWISLSRRNEAGGRQTASRRWDETSRTIHATSAPKTSDGEPHFRGQEHWADKDGRKLFLWEKQHAPGTDHQGTILFIHGSSWASLATFDLHVPGRPFSSVMDWFAVRGYDCWCLDNEGYGRSDKSRDINFGIENGAQDIDAATDYMFKLRGLDKIMLYGISAGALKSALFTQRHPERVARLALDAFVWTGEDSPTLKERRKTVPELERVNRRPFTRPVIQAVFDRDLPGTATPELIEAFAKESMKWDDTVPTGTYLDMSTKLPMVDPAKITVPTIVMRGQYDGIAGIKDLYNFFERLPHPDKHFAHMAGVSHASFQQTNYLLVYHTLHSFLSQPPAVFVGPDMPG